MHQSWDVGYSWLELAVAWLLIGSAHRLHGSEPSQQQHYEGEQFRKPFGIGVSRVIKIALQSSYKPLWPSGCNV